MKKPASLRFSLTANFILLGILPVIVIGVTALLILGSSLSKEIRTKNYALARSVSGEVRTFLKEPLSLLNQVDGVVHSDAVNTNDTINSYLEAVLENYKFFEALQYINSNGKVEYIAPRTPEYLGMDMSLQPFFRETLHTSKPTWSPTFISPQTGAPAITLSIASANSGVWVGYVNLQILSRIVAKISGEHAFAVITDQEGTVIAEKSSERVLQRVNLRYLDAVQQSINGKAGTFTVYDRGDKYILSTVHLPMTGWLVLFFQHYEDAFGTYIKIRRILILGVLLTLLASTATALLRARSIITPLDTLLSHAKKIAAGDYDSAAGRQKFTEFNELNEGFIAMAAAVQDREKSLVDRERLYRQLVETIPYGILEVDVSGVILFNNSALERIYEVEQGQLIGKYLWEKEASEDEQNALYTHFQTLVTEHPDPSTYYFRARTGKNRRIDIQADWQYKLNRKAEVTGFIFVYTDITEKKQMEDKLRQSQKMEAIGTLAGGIAHDFNNILAAILGYSELVYDNLADNSTDKEHQQQVLNACRRARDLVQHLLLFSRKQPYEKQPVELYILVREAAQLLRATVPATITFDVRIDKQTGVINANATQIHQVILNICTNALHAMEERGGELLLSLSAMVVEENAERAQELLPGRYGELIIADTGDGMPPETLERIFEPFYTTKDKGKGTGMGLAVVHGIVENHDGYILVDSTPGKGTRFRLYFPLAARQNAVEAVPRSVHCGNGQHILVVDDEAAIVRSTASNLERLGYTTTSTTSSLEALRVFEESPNAFDLILTDQAMPGLTGHELAKKILQRRTDVPVILCTGYSSTIDAAKAKEDGIRDFLLKPVVIETLSRKIAENLAEKW